jgi:WD40 repeat protein
VNATARQATVTLGRCDNLGSISSGSLVGFSPDGRTLAVVSNDGNRLSPGSIRLWDARTGKELPAVATGWGQVRIVHFSPDSRLIAAYDTQKGMGVWDARTGARRAAFRPHTVFENCVHFWFSPDSKSLIYEHYGKDFPNDHLMNVRDVGADRDRASLTGEAWDLTTSPDGKRLAATTTASNHEKRDRVLLWSWDAEKAPALLREYRVRVDHVVISPDLSAFATTDRDGAAIKLRVVDLETGRERVDLARAGEFAGFERVSFSPDGRFLIAIGQVAKPSGPEFRSTVWDVRARPARKLGTFPTHAPVISPDGRLLAVVTESGVELREVVTGSLRGSLTEPDDGRYSYSWGLQEHKVDPSVTFSPDGRVVVVGNLLRDQEGAHDSVVTRVWQTEPLKQLRLVKSGIDPGFKECFSPDGQALFVRQGDGEMRLWQLESSDAPAIRPPGRR